MAQPDRAQMGACQARGSRAERKLTGKEFKQRLCHHYGCPLLTPLAQQVA